MTHQESEKRVEREAAALKSRYNAICNRLGANSDFVWLYVAQEITERLIRFEEENARLKSKLDKS